MCIAYFWGFPVIRILVYIGGIMYTDPDTIYRILSDVTVKHHETTLSRGHNRIISHSCTQDQRASCQKIKVTA